MEHLGEVAEARPFCIHRTEHGAQVVHSAAQRLLCGHEWVSGAFVPFDVWLEN